MVSLVDQLGRLVRNAGGNSAAAQGAVALSGSFGEAGRAPKIASFHLEDVDNGDEVYRDTLTLTLTPTLTLTFREGAAPRGGRPAGGGAQQPREM